MQDIKIQCSYWSSRKPGICDGSTLYSVKTSTDNVYTINRVPSTATASLVGTATPATTGGAIDLAEWPCTQPV